MDRVQIIKEALNLNNTQTLVIANLIAKIPDERLIDFFAFRMAFVEPKQSAELITKNAVFAYRKMLTLEAIKNGKFRFKSIDGVIEFVQTFFKNERLCYGAKPFKDFVVLGVDEKGNLINHYKISDYGKPTQLSCDDEREVYEWLFKNQERIGVVKFISQKDTPAIKQISNDTLIDPDAPIEINREKLKELGIKLGFKKVSA
ncbi:hypothetical protein [Campylobacter mucosalis]|uniref:Uncharacterized protein n=1 Tax=Campylobacter mucosalis CCUG 21559 TaxID=1032067 RepID=A0A6G5QG81_9BACT|nr:hypothetical protein [Campylobacter mucosalis]QCD44106.1 hypothetical protein CMUC_0292 [Campylobacter mucosalis CCUG 21559]QCD44695.1 hypothetical protein CMUC_0906 [Campylobacter mucosalis CCUG 21559]